MPALLPGTTVYRNYDHEFEKTLSKKSAERKIEVAFELAENAFGFSLTAADEDFCRVTATLPFAKEPAQKDQQANYREQLSKLGNTPFELSRLTISLNGNWFIPSSALSDLKRRTIERLLSARKINYIQTIRPARHCESDSPKQSNPVYPQSTLTYLDNVANKNAEAFYSRCGVKKIEPAFENQKQENLPLMLAKHCILYQTGYCRKERKFPPDFKEPLYLVSGKNRLQLQFDCVDCEMHVI